MENIFIHSRFPAIQGFRFMFKLKCSKNIAGSTADIYGRPPRLMRATAGRLASAKLKPWDCPRGIMEGFIFFVVFLVVSFMLSPCFPQVKEDNKTSEENSTEKTAPKNTNIENITKKGENSATKIKKTTAPTEEEKKENEEGSISPEESSEFQDESAPSEEDLYGGQDQKIFMNEQDSPNR